MRIDYRICDRKGDNYLSLSRAGKTELCYDVGLGDLILRFDEKQTSKSQGDLVSYESFF